MTAVELPAVAEEAQGRSAGLVSRATADVVDVGVTIVLVFAVHLGIAGYRLVLHPRSFRWPQPGAGLLSFFAWGVFVLYLTITWSMNGRSLGKQMMGLRAQRTNGERLGVGRSFLRALLCATFPIGLLWCAIDRERRAVHDLILRTAVVYDWRRRVPSSARA